MQKIKLFLLSPVNTTLIALLLVFGLLFVAGAPLVGAQADKICEGVGYIDPNGQTQCDTGAEGTVRDIVKLVITVFSWVVGIVSVIMIIVGGLKYITSSGDSNSINSAKNTILYAIIGLVVVALAQIIVLFVLGNVDQATT